MKNGITNRALLRACLIGTTLVLAASPAVAQRQSAQDLRKDQMQQIPVCAARLADGPGDVRHFADMLE